MNNDMSAYQRKIKDNIKLLIEKNMLEEAKELLKQYESIVEADIDIYSIKGIIYMMEGDMDKAEKVLTAGLDIEPENFDLLYNMAYLHQYNGQIDLATEFYKKALQYSGNEKESDEVFEILRELGVEGSKDDILKDTIPKTSIIILTHNNLHYNKLCIESIRKYTEKGTYEIIVVDNHSTDGTVEWLKTQKDIRIILNDENLGFPKGCNQGIEAAYRDNDILLLNNDTIVTPNWLANLKKCLYSNNRIGAVGPVTNNCSYYQSIPTEYTDLDEMIKFAGRFNVSDSTKWEQRIKLVGYCILIKRSVIEQVGLLDERFTPGNFEDDDYSFRIQEAGYKLILCKDTFIHHFGSATFSSMKLDYLQLVRENEQKFKEKWGFNPFYSTFIRNEIIDLLNDDYDKRINVLEVGCACGATLLKIKDLYKNADLYGIEFEKMSSRIASNFASITSEDVEGVELSYPENFFDYIIFCDVLEHLYNPNAVLKKIRKYLKEDGKILISIPNVNHFSIIKSLLNQRWKYEDKGILDRTHVRFFTMEDLREMAEKSGYRISKVRIKEYNEVSPEDELFLKTLCQASKKSIDLSFRAYQYLLVLEK